MNSEGIKPVVHIKTEKLLKAGDFHPYFSYY